MLQRAKVCVKEIVLERSMRASHRGLSECLERLLRGKWFAGYKTGSPFPRSFEPFPKMEFMVAGRLRVLA